MRGKHKLPADVTTVNQCVGNRGMYYFMIISPIAVKIILPHASRAVIFLVIRPYDRKFYGQVVSGRTAVRGGAGVAGMIDLRSVAWWFGSRLPRQGWGRRRAGNCSSALRTTNYRSAKDQRAGPYVNIAGAAFGDFIVPSPASAGRRRTGTVQQREIIRWTIQIRQSCFPWPKLALPSAGSPRVRHL